MDYRHQRGPSGSGSQQQQQHHRYRHGGGSVSDESMSGQVSDAEPSGHRQEQATTGNSGRSGLPPRSRTGCWTCRRRKVKCDEGRPVCGQCLRLGQACDYGPRIAWRNDTPKIMEKSSMSLQGCPAWDPNLSELPRPLHYPPHHDALPSFPSLKSEDERELKATYHKPGTFTVNAIPSSFRSLPEYSDYDTEDQPQAPAPLTKTTSATAKSEGGSSSTTGRKGRGRSASGRKASAGAGGAGKGYGGNETSVVLERFENPSDKASLPLSASSASSSQQGGITSPYARLTDRLADPYAYDPQHYPSASHHPPSHQQYAVYASTSLPRPNLSALTTDQHQQQHHPHLPTHPHQPLAPMTLTSPTTTSPYHYQSGSFAPPPHPPQYPAPYQYAQAGMAPPYPQHPPRAYPAGPPPPLHYGGSAQYTTHDYGQHATSPTAHPAAVQQYGYEQLPRAEAMPRYSQVHPPPAPSPYETPRGVGIGGGGGAVMQLPLLGGRGPAQQGVLDQYPMGPGGVGAHGGQHGYGRYYSSGGAGGSEAHGYYEGEGE